jgi:hypothetical protein
MEAQLANGKPPFGSPDWLWQRYPDTFAFQVEPIRFLNIENVQKTVANTWTMRMEVLYLL